MAATVQRVFTPGTGATPPALTGREREQAVLTQCLADVLGGASPPHDVALMGPRGNGKTVLLNWFKRACRDHEADVDVVTLTPTDIATPTRCSIGWRPRRRWRGCCPGRWAWRPSAPSNGRRRPGTRGTCGRN